MAEIIAKEANSAFSVLKTLSDDERSGALHQIYQGLKDKKDEILKFNKIDLDNASKNNLSSSLIKRLDLSTGGKFDSMLEGILDVAKLPDPIGKCTLAKKLDEGLNLYRVTAPIGVLLIIFESRPEVIANITALAIKSGNSAILKGGKESYQTFKIMSDIVNEVLNDKTKVPKDAIKLIESREEVGDLLSQDKYIDLVIPRGSNQLVRNIKENTKIPVLGHADGICSIFVDESADIEKSVKVIVDSKTNYPAGCNAVEQLLIHEKVANDDAKLQKIYQGLKNAGVTMHATSEIKGLLPNESVVDADDKCFDTEYLSLDITVATIKSLGDAITHINSHSSKHTDCIMTESKENADKFLKGIDSAGIYWNCSTRFADGFRYGFGTEVGISTNKIHARGPVGLEGLMSYQYQLRGDGHIASQYKGAGGDKVFVHEDLDMNVKL
ncbi:gamma-glutamyl phosphate reductase [[Candida] jaroonii]|uniref:Gamma-glutamyl phosphate reductase n=1 Tax=[Candida] jaroonii TaxID=467808 RepID=A0ACA9Y2D6_9ASCO|nr:gamma-glutamyl phosphate reductase [[Candida] jaroonii]